MNPGKYTSLRLIEKLAFSIAKILTGKNRARARYISLKCIVGT